MELSVFCWSKGFVGYYISLHSWKSTSASVLQITLRRTSTTMMQSGLTMDNGMDGATMHLWNDVRRPWH
ncbi:hypothetical protein MRB53_028760 [Persea americana]|uniref:Uncharacterized protein n=1 Tax=Persea americana TaxID=3435 RepID=A0ACC2KGI7_PERAE|nr:hypothetical protein MRB53_028760 [Persea americana]